MAIKLYFGASKNALRYTRTKGRFYTKCVIINGIVTDYILDFKLLLIEVNK